MVIERLPSDKKTLTYHMGIPLIIHRAHNNRYTHQKMFKACHQKWIELNPKYQVIWCTDRQRDLFMKDFNKRVYNAYKLIKPGAFKADIWRLCVLYKYGGIYVDAYTTPVKDMSYIMKYLLPQEHNFISVLDCKEAGGGVHNGFIISSPRHPFLKQCIDDIVNTIEQRSYTDHVLAVTGPLCLERSIRKVLGNKGSFKQGYNYNGQLTFYLLKFEWGISQWIYDKGIRIMSKKYNTLQYFYDKIIQKKKGYGYMWHNKMLYER
jgi:mannosyltransferase OCH1-like enzyme